MTPLPIRKPLAPGILLLVSLPVSLIILLGLLSCRPESRVSSRASLPEQTGSEVSLVWEAWSLVKSSYVEGDTLDSKEAVGNMIMSMLDANEKPAYPFLTELRDVRERPPRHAPRELDDLWKAWVLFQEKWPDVDSKLLADAAIGGMLGVLGDESVAHLSPEAYDRSQERLKGSYQGIGASVTVQNGRIVMFPMENSPALKAGLQVGDMVLEVNGEPVEGKSLQEVVEQVRGPANTKVTLLVERPEEAGPIELDIIRGDIDTISVQRSLLPGAIGYIFISEFLENTSDEALTALEELKQVDMLALILDLRGNPGGSIESAQKVTSQFLADGLFMYEIDKEGNRRDWHIEGEGIATDVDGLPMVVLVNGVTGSAAEAVAGALQDTKRATVMGKTTFGKGSANVFEKLSDGSAIYISVSHWFTPTGRLIQGTGIQPDIEASLTVEDRMSGVDSQLAKAYEYLDEQLPDFR